MTSSARALKGLVTVVRTVTGSSSIDKEKNYIDKKMEFHDVMTILAIVVLFAKIILWCLMYGLRIEEEEEVEENIFPYHPRMHG